MNKVRLIDSSKAKKWSLRDGEIQHDSGRFYSIAGYDAFGYRKLMIKQPEVSLLGWLYNPATQSFLVQSKFEPGNVGEYLWTSTVQATLSNKDGVHQGKSVPYYEQFDVSDCQSEQSENGSAFYRKRNRNAFRIGSVIESAESYFWVNSQTMCDALVRDCALTTDARSALASSPWELWLPKSKSELYQVFLSSLKVNSCSREFLQPSLDECTQIPLTSLDHEEIAWVDVETNTREVARWQQPLLCGGIPKAFDLYLRYKCGLEFGFSEVRSMGLPNSMLGPSDEELANTCSAGHVICEMWQSEEGSRFWKDINQYRIVLVDCDCDKNLIWMSAGAMNQLAMKSMVFTGEARTLISLVLGALYQ